MDLSNLGRWGAVAAMVAGVTYVSEAIVFAMSPGGILQAGRSPHYADLYGRLPAGCLR